MKQSTFITQLAIHAVICIVLSFLFQEYILQDYHLPFLYITIGIFVVSSFVVHMLATQASKSDNKYVFSRMTMANSFIKLFVVVALVAVYHTAYKELSIDFIWPFILIYIIFTVFETKYLMKLAKS